MTPPKQLSHVLETCLYIRSMPEARRFYSEVLGLKPALQSDRITVFPLGNTTIILFQIGQTGEDVHPEGHPEHTIPKHGPAAAIVNELRSEATQEADLKGLRQHYCLAAPSRDAVLEWEQYFRQQGVPILGVMEWEKGGRSVYFADLDRNVGEIASPGIWPHY